MTNLQEQFNQQGNQNSVMSQASSSREMEEVKGQIFMARQFPRNVFQSEQRILDACKRTSLAQTAIYSYPRGNTRVEGPSIRLAEVLAQNWGNMSFGIKELEQREGESTAMAYAWDLETNVREEKVFTVKHSRMARGKLNKLKDPRDIYEMVANQGARRLRACILGIIPGDIAEKAEQECKKTMAGANKEPLKDRVNNALKAFMEQYRVTQEMVEAKFGYNAESFTEYDYLELIKIFTALKDGMSKVEDEFPKEVKKKDDSGLSQAFKEEQTKDTKKESKATDKPEKDVKKNDDSNGEQASFEIE